MDSVRKEKSGATSPTASRPRDTFMKTDNNLTEGFSDSASNYMAGFCSTANSMYSLSGVSPTMRNSGNVDTTCHGANSTNDTTESVAVAENTARYNDSREAGRTESKANNSSWTTSLADNEGLALPPASGSKVSLSGVSSSSVGICKFIKDEQDSSSPMEPQSPYFHPSGNITTSNSSYGTCDEDSATHHPPHMFTDYNRTTALPLIPKITEDQFSFPYPVGEVVANSCLTGYGQRSPQNSLMFKSELSKLSLPTSSPESQSWCQSTGLLEDQHFETGYLPPGEIRNTYVTHNSLKSHSLYMGMLSQKFCLICGDEASGCHYGVLTCGSCKVFYKRAVEGHQNYLCAGRNDCIVDKIRRKNCPACRLRKCYQAGMTLGGRKMKKLSALKVLGLTQSLAVRSPLGASYEGQALATLPSMPMVRELQFTPQMLSVLESIEPETVYSGYDGTQPETPHLLLNSLNRLCERQLLWIVRWSKSLPGFRSLHINDQMTLIQYSWMSMMVFSLGWRSFQNVTREFLYFAPDLILSEEKMRNSPISDLCMAMQIIPQAFDNLHVTKEEFLCMKVLLLLNTVPLEGLRSQAQFDEMRHGYIRELTKAIQLTERGVVASSQRFYHLTKLMDAMHEIVRKVNLYCLSTFIQAEAMQVEFPEMMSEVITSQLPKVLAGMVRPLLFHKK
ncbi:progesterone receptor isoform X1 [Anguilla anguilla]|uniref:progesterone receptor isoform X1 n=1 Tax=Anguilla anguilla TaxID=7936 RepID=UPI0015AB4DAD|nr:progesterone receptor isoform X1 [Anguilla anguilla]